MLALIPVCVRRHGEFTAQHLSHLAWSYASAQVPAEDLFACIANAAVKHAATMEPKDISNLAWSFAKLGISPTELFHAFADHAPSTLCELDPVSMTNVCWAYATAEPRGSKATQAVLEVGESAFMRRRHGYGAGQIADLSLAFVHNISAIWARRGRV